MRIGIFGGSFNPPHQMHQSIAESLIQKDYLDHIIFVPTSNYYPKPGLVQDQDRLRMVQYMIEDNSNFSVSDYEFGRLTYTYQTLEYFQKQYPNDSIYFICGSDNLETMDTWREYEKILSDFKVVVISRGSNQEDLLKKYKLFQENIIFSDVEEDFLSSTLIREKLEKGNIDDVRYALNNKVLDYIVEHQLYQGDNYD